jgi:type I restriction enzyme, R subunit
VRENTKVDWDKRESVRAQMRVAVRRVLRRHKYPPDRTDDATETVVRQAELLTANLAP